MKSADVVVIGAGSIGAMALWQLSQHPDLQVIGIDAHARVNLGSSYAGESRLFRTAVKEGPVFNDHAHASIDLWRTLEASSGRAILEQCGALSIGPADFEAMRTTRDVVERYDLPHETFDANVLFARFPQFSADPDDVGILDTRGGFLRPEVAVTAAHTVAAHNGAQLYFNTRVTALESDADSVQILTNTGAFRAAHVIVTMGSWTAELLPQLSAYVEVRPIGLTWAMPHNIQQFQPDVFPVFMRDRVTADGTVTHWFGTPTLDNYSIKIGTYPEPWTSPIPPWRASQRLHA